VIQDEIQPNVEPGVYPDLDTALKDLHNGQLDGVVVDFPDAFYGYADQIVGQFPQLSSGQEQFGLAFEKGNPFIPCVNEAIAALQSNGTLKQLDNQWLETDASVPVFS
jgi:polar amino acid transport system substrate-binding protein